MIPAAVSNLHAMMRLYVNGFFRGLQPFDVFIRSVAATLAVLAARRVWKERREIPATVMYYMVRAAKLMPGVGSKISAESEKNVRAMLDKMRLPLADFETVTDLHQGGHPASEVLALMKRMKEVERSVEHDSRVSGTIYVTNAEIQDLIADVFRVFVLNNTLHPDVFPCTRKFEAEVVRMTLNMMRAPADAHGAMTSGGTESILMALKTYRDSRPDVRYPEVIAPVSAHVAFDKGCHYFGIKMVHAPLNDDFTVDVRAVEKLISGNTILLVGSAVSFPQGVVDDIPALSALGRKHNLPLHVDSCLGGFVLPFLREIEPYASRLPAFDFSLDGVTSMSCDMHKYGMTPKGTSSVLFRSRALARHMYFTYTTWPGGFYASPTLGGSKAGALVAAAWAVMHHIGHSGYVAHTRRVMDTAERMKDGLCGVPGIKVLVTDLQFPVVAFSATTFDVYCLLDALPQWNLNVLQRPNCLHICVTGRHADADCAQQFVDDVRDAAARVVADPSQFNATAPIYGAATAVPDRTLVEDFLLDYTEGALMV